MRAWNFYMIFTPNHVIQNHYAYFAPFCSTAIKIYDKNAKDFMKSKVQQDTMLKCPVMDIDTVILGDSGLESYRGLESTVRRNGNNVDLKYNASSINFQG